MRPQHRDLLATRMVVVAPLSSSKVLKRIIAGDEETQETSAGRCESEIGKGSGEERDG